MMKRFDLGLSLAVCFAAMISGAVAQPVPDPNAMARVMGSGNYMLPLCQHAVAVTISSQPNVWDGECMAVISTLFFLGRGLADPWKICPPNYVTNQQGLRIAVKYMEAHPEKLHLNFKELAMSALAETWPCR
jgi:hypothetical protein